jgi:hypothetical protein
MSRASQPVTVDLTGFPDLTVVYLGMKVTKIRGVATLLGLGRPLRALGQNRPDGLLHQDLFLWRIDHVGIRQYWRDFDALECFTRSAPHSIWWREFSAAPRGTGFWHETYRKAGGMEGIYLHMPEPGGFASFAPHISRAGLHATARRRSDASLRPTDPRSPS